MNKLSEETAKDTLVLYARQKEKIHSRKIQIKHNANSASELVREAIDFYLSNHK